VTLKIIELVLPVACKAACAQDGFGVRDDGVDVVSCLLASCHRLGNQKKVEVEIGAEVGTEIGAESLERKRLERRLLGCLMVQEKTV
jgi:hypothetical protein